MDCLSFYAKLVRPQCYDYIAKRSKRKSHVCFNPIVSKVHLNVRRKRARENEGICVDKTIFLEIEPVTFISFLLLKNLML